MRMHGSVLPQMILPLLLVGGWATLITCVSHFYHNRKFSRAHERWLGLTVGVVGVNDILLTVLGFVVGLSLTFRGSTAYERQGSRTTKSMNEVFADWNRHESRWAEGRAYWAQLIQISRNLARIIWVHIDEREGETGKVDILRKLYESSPDHALTTKQYF